jgi:hypothetical protein
MQRDSLFLLVALATLVMPTAALATELPADYRKWFVCESDTECVVVWGGCGDVAVNKKYSDKITPSPVCSKSSPHNPNVVGKCINGQCETGGAVSGAVSR